MIEPFSMNELAERISAAIPSIGQPALALVQGYPFTRLMDAAKVIECVKPPNTWEDFFDLRLFGSAGEWHTWNLGEGMWGARLWKAKDHSSDLLRREFPLWGHEIHKREDGWALLREANGAEVWVPESATAGFSTDETPTIAILEAVEIVGYQECTGLAGIVDCALLAVKPNPHAA